MLIFLTVSADTKGSNWSLEAIFEERNGLCENEEYPPPGTQYLI